MRGAQVGNGNTEEADKLIVILGEVLKAVDEELNRCILGDPEPIPVSDELESRVTAAVVKYKEYIK
ncbi:MAG: hypothetical protein V3S69_05930 [Dehalococcoidales bacterium]